MCAVTHSAKPYQLALLFKKNLADVIGTQKPVKPLYNTSIEIFISPLCMLCLQKVLLVHLNICVYYINQNCLCMSPLINI